MGEWERVFRQHLPLPPHPQRGRARPPPRSTAFRCILKHLHGSALSQVGLVLCALQGVEYQLRLSLFDATYHHFFGRTWRSSWRAASSAPPRLARATFNEVGAAKGLGKHRTKPFSIPFAQGASQTPPIY
uniref:Uncharacterized protein n=1 Tax=Serinus canaria TaxID=9135 RepID=A0A8C9L2A1_SERCA